jgi:hypothetical protein
MRLLTLLLPLAIAPSMVCAAVQDPTGAWLIKNDNDGPNPPVFFLNVFHQGGTLTGDLQGEGGFDPHATGKPKVPFNIINSPESGVWQKTGWNTFAVTFLTMEYQVDTHANSLSTPLFQFDKVQYTGFLIDPGDRMEITELVITNFNPQGELTGGPNKLPFKFHGVRIPLEILDSTARSLPIP